MALSKKAKIWLVVLSIPLVIIAGAAIFLKVYFTNERLKGMAIPVLEDATQRRVSISDISLSLFPTLGLEIDSLNIDNNNSPGFTDRPLVLLDHLVLDLRIAALLKNTVEVNTIVIERPQIFIEMNEAGVSNYATEEVADERNIKVKTKNANGAGFLLSNFQIINGTITYVNHKKHSQTIIDGLNTTVRMELIPAAEQMHVESNTTVEKFSWGSDTTLLLSDLKVFLEQKMVYDVKNDLLSLQDGRGKLEGLPFTVNGSVSDITKMFMMNIVVESKDANIADLFSLVPKEYVKSASGLKGTGTAQVNLNIGGTVNDSTEADVTGRISASNARIQYEGLPKPITDITIDADFARTKDKQEFNITTFSALLGGSSIQSQLSVKNFDAPALMLAVSALLNLAEVKEYYPLETGTSLSGQVRAEVNIAGKLDTPEAMKASGAMEFKGVTIVAAGAKSAIRNLNGALTITNQAIETGKLSMNLGKSDLSLAFRLKNYLSLGTGSSKAPKPTASLTLTSNHIYTSDIMADEGAQPASNTADKKNTPTAPRSGLPLPNVDMDVQATIGTLTMQKFELTNVRSTMKVANNVLDLKNFSCNAFGGSVNTKGTLNVQHPSQPLFDLALDLNSLDGNMLLSEFTPFGQRIFGKLTMNTTMKGTLDDTLGLISKALSGNGRVQLEGGKLAGVKVNQQIASLVKLPDLEVINFKDWANTFSITDGKLLVKDLKIKALGADYVINGTHGLDGSLGYSLSMLLSDEMSAKVTIPGFAGEAARFFNVETNGRLKLDFAVGGTMENPNVVLDTKPAQKRMEDFAKQKLNNESKKLEDQLKKKSEDLFKDLFKKK